MIAGKQAGLHDIHVACIGHVDGTTVLVHLSGVDLELKLTAFANSMIQPVRSGQLICRGTHLVIYLQVRCTNQVLGGTWFRVILNGCKEILNTANTNTSSSCMHCCNVQKHSMRLLLVPMHAVAPRILYDQAAAVILRVDMFLPSHFTQLPEHEYNL